MTRDELSKLISELQNLKHMLTTAGNVSPDALKLLEEQIQELIRQQNTLINFDNEPTEMD